MIKTRIIGVLVVKNGWVVQSIKFSRYLPIGSLKVNVEYLNQWGIDEIIILDIDAGSERLGPDVRGIEEAAKFSQSPLAIGGGIRSTSDMESALRAGADKVVINTQFLKTPEILGQGANQFGSQCMVVSIDAVKNKSGEYETFTRLDGLQKYKVIDAVRIAQDNGAGEIFLNSVDRDGMKCGYDLNLSKKVQESVQIPVIHCGGVGRAGHLLEGIKSGMNAVAAGNFFHFTEMSVVAAKQILRRGTCDVRLDSYATYESANFDSSSDRVSRLHENDLDNLRFSHIADEVI